MTTVKCILGVVVLLMSSVQSDAAVLRSSTDEQETPESDTDLPLLSGDSGAFRRARRNADPCVKTDMALDNYNCKWPRHRDGNVYVPYRIDQHFDDLAKWFIPIAAKTFSFYTCIRFTPWFFERDYVYIQKSADKSSSVIGRSGGPQPVYLTECDSLKFRVVIHELLHTLGFHHEFVRSDRDQHVIVKWDNIEPNEISNFHIKNTKNLDTPYDFSSIMHYDRMAGSRNGLPTLEALHFEEEFGKAMFLSATDIERINRLYCTRSLSERFSDWLSGLVG